jgi:hypothetical protein
VRPAVPGLALLGIALLGAPRVVSASSVKIWVANSASDFSAGEARGVSVGTDGTLVPGLALEKVSGVEEPVLFSAAAAAGGGLFVGTGDSGRVLRLSPKGSVEVYVRLPENEVTALRTGPDGALYAGTSPGGKVYRIVDGKAAVYYETKAQYVWCLAFTGSTLWVGTGLPGEIHRVDSAGQGTRVPGVEDAHVRALFVDGKGRLWAGTSGSGRVLRLEGGRVATVYDSGKTEVAAITADRSGRVWAAASSASSSGGTSEPVTVPATAPPPRPPKAPTAPGEDEEKAHAEVTVSVSTARLAPARGTSGKYSSEIVLFGDDEPPRAVWKSDDEIVFDLAPGAGDAVLAATGPSGKLYAIEPDSSALVRTFDETEVTLLAGHDVGTNGGSALYRPWSDAPPGEYVSAVKDTGRTSRFGAFRWEGDAPAGTTVEFAFRSGESNRPDATWSRWSPWVSGATVRRVEAPDGRYVQWRVRMSPGGGHSPAVRRVDLAYRNRNVSPEIESFQALDPTEVLARSGTGGSNVFESSAPDEKGIFTGLEDSRSEGTPRKLYRKGYRTLQWKAKDPDGDTLVYDLEFRPVGASVWIPLRKDLHDSFYAFDSTSLPDGEYVFRLSASDADVNPGEGKVTSRESAPVRIDNTPPEIRLLARSPGRLEIEAVDAGSPIVEAEYSVDAREWIRIEPADGLSDSPRETYIIRVEAGSRGAYLLVRVTDAARNVAAASFPAP